MAKDKVRTAIDIYMQDIGKLPLLSREEEAELAALIAQGSQEAFDRLVTANLRLVVKIAHDYKNHGLLEDIISAGNQGLIRAAQKFDPDKGAKFSSYAAWWIKQSIRRITSEDKLIVIPVASLVKIYKIRKADYELSEKLGYNPTNAELAKHIGLTECVVKKYRNKKLDSTPIGLSDSLGDDNEGCVGDLIPDDTQKLPLDIIISEEYYDNLDIALKMLDKRSRLVILHRFGLKNIKPKTLDEISSKINRTRERVRQIQNDAISKLRRELYLMDRNKR